MVSARALRAYAVCVWACGLVCVGLCGVGPWGSAEVCAQTRAEAHTGQTKRPKRKRKRKRRRRRKRPAKYTSAYGTFALATTMETCVERSPVCPESAGVGLEGLLGVRIALGYRWRSLVLGGRVGGYTYGARSADGAELEGTFGELLGELRFAPVGERSRWDPYVVVGAGLMIASVEAARSGEGGATFNTGTDGEASMRGPGGVVGAGIDYLFMSNHGLGDYGLGLVVERFALMDHRTSDVAGFWSARLRAVWTWDRSRPRRARKRRRPKPAPSQPAPRPRPRR